MQRQTERGAALISAVLVMMLMSALLVGLMALVIADQQSLKSGNDQANAYVSAHAGLEKLTADLGALFKVNYSPTAAQVNALTGSSYQPSLAGISFIKPNGTGGYSITYPTDSSGNPAVVDPNGTPITHGSYAGLKGLITPYTMDVTARTSTGAEVRLTRTVESVAIPVFQFGIFSETDLSFHAGPPFNFGGRVHTNSNLYLAQSTGNILTLGDKVTAVGEVVRSHLASGRDISASGHTGTVLIATQANGCPAPPAVGAASATCRALAWTSATNNEGSVLITSQGGANNLGYVPPSTFNTTTNAMVLNPNDSLNNPTWGSTVVPAYNPTGSNYLLNGSLPNNAGAHRLVLPIVDTASGASPIDLIKRPLSTDPTGPGTTYDQRFFRLASLRILLSDNATDITGLPGVSAGAPVNLATLDTAGGYTVDNTHPPIARSAGTTGMTAGATLINGFIKIERQDANTGLFVDITSEILNLGIAGRSLSNGGVANSPADPGSAAACPERSPNAVIRFERLNDTPQGGAFGNCGQDASGNWQNNNQKYIPNVLYDAREGSTTECDTGQPMSGGNCTYTGSTLRLGGVMHYVEFDVQNYRRWLLGTIGTTGTTNPMNVTGFVVYFSDRRGNHTNASIATAGTETGELGWEDMVVPNNSPDAGEDVNGKNGQELYGNAPLAVPNSVNTSYLNNPATATTLRTVVDITNARSNPTPFFRRALKVVDAGMGSLPNNGNQGLTIASENPVYLEGNFNACGTPYAVCNGATGFTDISSTTRHYSASVIADSVTFLSTRWNDIRSFNFPHNVGTTGTPTDRSATTTWYRLAVISGKGLNFPWDGSAEADRGTDGGVHNFLRYVENWNGQTLHYLGSMVSLYINRQGVGVFKCCQNVYQPPNRAYQYDSEFLTPSLLPPRTPMFRDIDVLSFRESFEPTQP